MGLPKTLGIPAGGAGHDFTQIIASDDNEYPPTEAGLAAAIAAVGADGWVQVPADTTITVNNPPISVTAAMDRLSIFGWGRGSRIVNAGVAGENLFELRGGAGYNLVGVTIRDMTLVGNTNCGNGIDAQNVQNLTLSGLYVTLMGGAGVYIFYGNDVNVDLLYLYNNDSHGLEVAAVHEFNAHNCHTWTNGGAGYYTHSQAGEGCMENHYNGCTSEDNDYGWWFRAVSGWCYGHTINGGSTDMEGSTAVVLDSVSRCVVSGLYLYSSRIRLDDADSNVITHCTYSPSSSTSIYLRNGSDYNVVSDNVIECGAGATIRGIFVDDSDWNEINDNIIHGGGNDCIELDGNSDNNSLDGNLCEGSGGYGITISAAACNNTRIGHNLFSGNTLGPFRDLGTDTMLPTLPPKDFVYWGGGSAGYTVGNPSGIDIDANGEIAVAHIPLPLKVQRVVRIKIWAYSIVAEATNNMLLEIRVDGGGSSQAFNTEAIDVVNHPSEETGGIAINDVIHWVIDAGDDADIGDLRGGDYLEVQAIGEAAVAPDIATDALFGGIEIEYV